MIASNCHRNLTPARSEQNLRMNSTSEPGSLDPRKGSDPISFALHAALFEGLTRLNPDFTTTPAQAKTIQISNDRKTYTFFIGDYYWSNGLPVTAYDFEKTWKDILNPKFPGPNAYLLYGIKHAESVKKGLVPMDLVGIQSLGPKTLVIELEHPASYFLQITASSALSPICAQHDKEHPSWAAEEGKDFVCNGPFHLATWRRRDEMMLEKNPSYRRAKEVKLQSIQISFIDNEMAALHMYASGFFDLLGMPFCSFPVSSLNDLSRKNLLTNYPVAGSLFCAFNTKGFPFHNVHIRRAFGLAIHRKKIVDHITQLHESIAYHAVPPILKQHCPKPFYKDGDDAQAQEELRLGLLELGIKPEDLSEVTLSYWPSELHHNIAQTLAQNWLKALRIKIKLESIDFKLLLNKVAQSTYSIGIFASLAQYNDPMSILERFKVKDTAKNYACWESNDFAHLLHCSELAPSPQIRGQFLEEAETLLLEQMPIAPIFHWTFPYLIQPYVKNFAISPIGIVYFDRISIDCKKKLKTHARKI